MRYVFSRAVAAAIVGTLAALTVTATPARAAFPGPNGRIAIDSGAALTLWTAGPNGSGQIPLGSTGVARHEPSFSSDGRRVVYTQRAPGGTHDVWVINADGTGAQQLTRNPASAGEPIFMDREPTFAPDGTKIAYSHSEPGGMDIWVMNADGSGQTPLTRESGGDTEPEYSPDGSKIVFISGRLGVRHVFLMNADGSNQVPLTTDPGKEEGSPSFSPDGTKIVFHQIGLGFVDIVVMNVDGTGMTVIPTGPELDTDPVFSPDGTKIAFYSRRAPAGIWVMNLDGTGAFRVGGGFDPAERPTSWGVGAAPNTPSPPGHQNITVTVPSTTIGALTLTVGGGKVNMTTPVFSVDRLISAGVLGPVTISDTRRGNEGPYDWTASGQTSMFQGSNVANTFSAAYLGWTPTITPGGTGGGVVGPAVSPGFQPRSPGLSTSQIFATGPAGHPLGSNVFSADLLLHMPITQAADSYSSVLTFTILG